MDQWQSSDGIHSHGKGVPLGGSFLGKQCLTIDKELRVVSVGIDEQFGKWGVFLVDIQKGHLPIQRVKCIHKNRFITERKFLDQILWHFQEAK